MARYPRNREGERARRPSPSLFTNQTPYYYPKSRNNGNAQKLNDKKGVKTQRANTDKIQIKHVPQALGTKPVMLLRTVLARIEQLGNSTACDMSVTCVL